MLLEGLHEHIIHFYDLAHEDFSFHPDSFGVFVCLLQCDQLLFDYSDFPLEALQITLKVLFLTVPGGHGLLEGAFFPLQF